MMKKTIRRIAISTLLVPAVIYMEPFISSRFGIKAESVNTINREIKFSDLAGERKALRISELNQEKGGNPISSSEKPEPCETAASYLDLAVIDTRKLEKSYLIIIARLGTGEKSSRLNKERLEVVEEYVLRRGSDLKYILAEGSRVKGLGRIELYVGGQLYRVMPLEKNSPTYCIPGREGN